LEPAAPGRADFFQTLEKVNPKVPNLGKNGATFSDDWKNCLLPSIASNGWDVQTFYTLNREGVKRL